MDIKGITTMQITREAEIREKEQTGQKNNYNQILRSNVKRV